GAQPTASRGVCPFPGNSVCGRGVNGHRRDGESPYSAINGNLSDAHPGDAVPGGAGAAKYCLVAGVSEGKLGTASHANKPLGTLHCWYSARNVCDGNFTRLVDSSGAGAVLPAMGPGSGAFVGACACRIDNFGPEPDRRLENSFYMLLSARKGERAVYLLGVRAGLCAS